jgi:hypothetical protein
VCVVFGPPRALRVHLLVPLLWSPPCLNCLVVCVLIGLSALSSLGLCSFSQLRRAILLSVARSALCSSPLFCVCVCVCVLCLSFSAPQTICLFVCVFFFCCRVPNFCFVSVWAFFFFVLAGFMSSLMPPATASRGPRCFVFGVCLAPSPPFMFLLFCCVLVSVSVWMSTFFFVCVLSHTCG